MHFLQPWKSPVQNGRSDPTPRDANFRVGLLFFPYTWHREMSLVFSCGKSYVRYEIETCQTIQLQYAAQYVSKSSGIPKKLFPTFENTFQVYLIRESKENLQVLIEIPK